MGCINKNLKDNQRLIQDFSETRVNQLFDEYFQDENPSYGEFISNPNVKEALGIIPISKVKSEIGKAFGKEISSRELKILKKSISNINDKLLGHSYKLFNIKQKGESDNYSWGLRKINSNINIQAKIDRLKQRINTGKQIRNLEDNQFNFPDVNSNLNQGLQWLKEVNPNVQPEIVQGLIDGIANGSYNSNLDLITLSEEFANKKTVKHEFLHKILASLPFEQREAILNEASKKYGIARGESKTTTNFDVILPIGTSGSGKSTFIKSLPQENLVIIEPDAMRVEFTGDMNNKSKDKEIYIEAANRAIKAIKQGKQVVFDTTNLTKDKRTPFIEAIQKAIPTANIQYKLMELNPELAKQRIKAQLARGENRANVSDETIDRHAESYKQMLEDIKNEPISEFQSKTTTKYSQAQQNEINYVLKAVDILQSDKGKQVFEKGRKSNWDLNKILTELQIPKEQKQLILDLGKTEINDITTDLLTNYSYTVEINTAKKQSGYNNNNIPYTYKKVSENNYVIIDPSGTEIQDANSEIDAKNRIVKLNEELKKEIEIPTSHYSNLTVPGGTAYTENEISTPLITPSIKGHAQFATSNGIGWFRSDEKENKVVGWKEEDDFLNSETAQYNPITKDDKIIWGHPAIGKSYAAKKVKMIDFDSYKIGINRKYNLYVAPGLSDTELRTDDKTREARENWRYENEENQALWNQFIRDAWQQAKQDAKQQGAILFASDLLVLREFGNEVDKALTMPDELFFQRSKQRNNYIEGPSGTKVWKGNLNKAVANFKEKFGRDKVINTDKYLSDLLEGNPKTRRILEVQSDLFQKGRDEKKALAWNRYILDSKGDVIGENPNFQSEQDFLNLLRKDSNWVTFFVKSIIQDSAKKGYEKVLFPSGNTASKVEGHTTLEEFKKQKEDRIKELENENITGNKELEDLHFEREKLFINAYKEAPSTYDIDRKIEQTEKRIKEKNIVEIAQLKKELERVEIEGFGALKPIYNFYENTVTNILNKTYGKENVKLITDEYGNTWNEIDLSSEKVKQQTDKILFQSPKLQYTGDLAIEEKIAEEAENSKDEIVAKTPLQKFIQSIRNLLRNIFREKDKISRLLRDMNQGRLNSNNRNTTNQDIKYQVFERNEVLFQKIRFKQIKQEKNLKNDNVQGSYDFSDIFHYPFDEVYDELDQSEPTGEFEDTFDSEFETNSKKLDKIILNRYLKIQKSLERQKDKLVSEFNKIENTNDFTKDAEIYFDKHKELISEINVVEEKLKRIKAVVDAIFDKKDITSVVIAESNLIIDDINKLLKSENISPAELDYYYNLTKLLEEIHDENLKQEDSSLFTNASSEDLNQLKKLKNTFSNLNNDLLELLRKNINIKNDPIKDAKLFSQWFLKVGDYTNDILKKAESMISKSLFNITKFLNKELEAIKELHLKADSDFKRTGKQNNKFDIFFDKNKRIVQVFNYEYTDAAAKLYNAFRFASKDSAKSKRLELIRFHKQHSILLNAKYLFPDIYEHLTGTKVSAEEINKNIALYKSYLDDYTFEKMKSKVYKQTIKYLSKRDNDFFMSNMPFDENSLIQEFLTYIPKDKSNYNDKYSKIVQNDNLRNVYDKFMDLFNELKLISQGTTRSNLNKGFLPFLEKTMIENLSDFSFSTELGKFKQSILSSYDQLKNNSGQTVSNQVENSLKTVNDGLRSFLETKANDYYKQEKINLIYFLTHKKLTTNSAKLITEKFGPGFPSKKAEEIIESWTKEYFTNLEDSQTNDIQVLMNLMAQTVTSYKQKQAIESNLNLIKIAFDNQTVGEFDILGNLVGTNPTKKGRETKLAELLEVTINHFFGKNVQKPQLNDFLKRINNVSVAKQEELNKLVKEINENKELTPNEKIELEKALQNKFKKDSKYVDLDKINDKLLQYLRVLFLGWSPKSAFFNAAMGHIGNYMETIDGRIVDRKDLSVGVKMLFGKEKKKIQKLIANLSLIEDITKDFKKTTEESLHNEKWKNFKPERLQQIVEKSNQSPLIAALLNKSFNGVRIIDMIDESGNFLPQYEEYEYKFVNTAKYLIEKVHGPYDSNRIIMAETTSLGKNVIFMKKWMITSFFMKRFGSFDEKPREDLLMDYQFKGTYITLADVFNTMSNDQSGQRNYLLGIMKTMKAIALSDQSLTEVDKANLRSVRADLLIIGALLIAQQLVKYMLSDDDDDHEGLVFLLNTFFRIETELGSHYFLIDTFEGLAKNTIPQLDVYNRLEKIIKSFDENARISPAIRLAQMVPVLNSGVSLYNFFNQQILYNR